VALPLWLASEVIAPFPSPNAPFPALTGFYDAFAFASAVVNNP